MVVAVTVLGSSRSDYQVKARFQSASQLVKGADVQTGGIRIGSVKDIAVTPDGQAEITLDIRENEAPLRQGTRAAIRQFSQSGVANRYVDLTFPPASAQKIPDGGVIDAEHTKSQVDLDALFNTFDPRTRRALQDFFKGQAAQFRGRGAEANVGLRYLNPAMNSTSRLFRELSRDTPLLEGFLVDSSRLVTTLAERRDQLAALVGNLNQTTRALGDQKAALAESISRLPPFMRRANSTFVDVRSALDDVDPLVDASKPVAARLGPFLSQARGFAHDFRPAVADLRVAVRRRGRGNDLVELLRAAPPLADIATVTRRRTYAPGRRPFSVGSAPGALPQLVEALKRATPAIAFARPYTTDFLGWFDDFSTTGANVDALGANARAHIGFNQALSGPVRSNQVRRCPGAAEAPAPDGSNVFSPEQQARLRCRESDRATGP